MTTVLLNLQKKEILSFPNHVYFCGGKLIEEYFSQTTHDQHQPRQPEKDHSGGMTGH